ncbi:MAG: STAS domain-containing protein [Mediterranea sp.]|nr:STAS domain-containing protein [Mediterranea sp.]
MKLEIIDHGAEVKGILIGRLDTAASAQFATDMQPLIDRADKHILLDCSQLEFISSSGLRLFLTLRKATIAAHGDITIMGMNNEVKQVFTLTGFLSLFKFA